MAGSNPKVLVGPVLIAATATGTNIPTTGGGSGLNLNSPAASTYWVVKHIRVVNNDATARTVTLYKGATGGSDTDTPITVAKSVPANDYIDIYFPAGDKWTTADFLSGFASVTNTLSIAVYGDVYTT